MRRALFTKKVVAHFAPRPSYFATNAKMRLSGDNVLFSIAHYKGIERDAELACRTSRRRHGPNPPALHRRKALEHDKRRIVSKEQLIA